MAGGELAGAAERYRAQARELALQAAVLEVFAAELQDAADLRLH